MAADGDRRDSLHPTRVRALVDEHDRVMRNEQDTMAMSNAIYLTRFWDYFVGWGAKTKRFNWRWSGTEIEVNTFVKEVSIYSAALYPRANRVNCSPDPMGKGDHRIGTVALNGSWQRKDMHRRVHMGVVMALLFPGCGFKVGYDPGRGSPIGRTWIRVIPPWEMVLDRNVGDIADERYRGHLYYAPKDEIEDRYPKLRGKLVGTRRQDFIEQASQSQSGAPANETNNPDGSGEGDELDDSCVRVFELCNLRDTIVGKGGDVYKGRLEVWVLDQANGISEKPVAMTPLPFADAEGVGLPNIEPLIFASQPAYPLRPVAPIVRLIEQAKERNIYRTQMAQDTRRNARKGLMREGAIEQDQVDNLMDGVDMNFAKVKQEAGPLEQVIKMIDHQPVATDTLTYMQIVDGDYQRVAGTSPNARGEITKATAFEVQQTQLFTESDLGFHGLLLNDCLVRVLRLLQRALIGAMQDYGDSEGGDDDGVLLAAASSVSAPAALPDAEQAAGATAASLSGAPSPAVSPEAAAASPGGVAPKEAVERRGKSVKLTTQAFSMVDRDEKVMVTVEALDADFEISFVEGGRTPLNDHAMLQFLTGPQADLYFKLFAMVLKGGPEGIIAERWMAHLAERADLPKDLHPSELKMAVRRLAESGADAPRPTRRPPAAIEADAPPEQVTPEPQAPASPQDGRIAVLVDALRQALSLLATAANVSPEAKAALLPAGRALASAIQAASTGATDRVTPAVVAAHQALQAALPELPPEAQEPAREALAGLQTLLRAVAASTAPVQPPPEA